MKMNLWINSILDSQEKYELQLSKAINNIDVKNFDKDETIRDLLEISYTGLEDSYKIGKECLKKEYDIVDNSTPNVRLIKNLIYNKDGKIVDDRVLEHAKKFIDKFNKPEDLENISLIRSAKQELKEKLFKIQNTEAVCVFNNTLTFIAEKHGYTGYRIISIGECTSHTVNCNDEDGKEYEIKDLDHKPPFHPNCKCTIELIKEGE